jgi:hypothetical protein
LAFALASAFVFLFAFVFASAFAFGFAVALLFAFLASAVLASLRPPTVLSLACRRPSAEKTFGSPSTTTSAGAATSSPSHAPNAGRCFSTTRPASS